MFETLRRHPKVQTIDRAAPHNHGYQLVSLWLVLPVLMPGLGYGVLGYVACSPVLLYNRVLFKNTVGQATPLSDDLSSPCVLLPTLNLEDVVPAINLPARTEYLVGFSAQGSSSSLAVGLFHIHAAYLLSLLGYAAWLSWKCNSPQLHLRASLLLPLLPPPETA